MKVIIKIIGIILIAFFSLAYVLPKVIAIPIAAWQSNEVWNGNQEPKEKNCSQSFETYVVYDNYLPVYDSINGKKIAQFRFEDDPSFDFGKHILFDKSSKGWLRIKKISSDQEHSLLINKWVKSSNVQISTRNYGGQIIDLKSEANKSASTIAYIEKETDLSVLSFCDGWVLTSLNGSLGWVDPYWVCINEVTTCN